MTRITPEGYEGAVVKPRTRKIGHHTLISAGKDRYFVEGIPGMLITRYYGSGRGNASFRAWSIEYNGMNAYRGAGINWDAGDLDRLDKEIAKWGPCSDCGRFVKRQFGHEGEQSWKRCIVCDVVHRDLRRGYMHGAAAAKDAGMRWDRAAGIVAVVLAETGFHLDHPTGHVTPSLRNAAIRKVFAALEK